jgi:hypothetical protein
MTHLKRSRRARAGLVGLSVVSALAAAVGLGVTTHTGSSAQATNGTSGGQASHTGSQSGHHRSSSSTTSGSASAQRRSNLVTQPTQSAPQATTSGS